jgi:hypothetical protein
MAESWVRTLQDAVLDNAALRDGFQDAQAEPFIDWGWNLAAQVGLSLDALPLAEAEAQAETAKSALLKLLLRMNWLARHHASKGTEWTATTLGQMNGFARQLWGESAPQLDAERYVGVSRDPVDYLSALMHDLQPAALS